MKEIRFIMQYIRRHKWHYAAGIVTLFVVDFANLYIPRITGAVTDGLTDHTLDWNGVKSCLLALLLLGLTLAIGRFLWRYFLFGSARKIERELRNDLFAHLEEMSVDYFNENKTGDLMTRFTSDLNAIRMAIGMAVISAFDATVMTVMVIGQMMVYVNVKLTLLALIPMVIICGGTIYYGKIIHARYMERQEAVSDLTDYVQESFSGIRVIKAFVREQAQLKAFTKANENTREKNLSLVRLQAVVMPLLEVFIGISSLVTLIYGGYLAIVGEITLGRFVAFHQYVNMLVWPMLACGDAINTFAQGGASIKRVQAVMEEEPGVRDLFSNQPQPCEQQDSGTEKSAARAKERLAADTGRRQGASLTGQITFSHLTYTHKGALQPDLRDVCLEVPAGTTLAVIGRTGSGKSTLVNLMLHLYNTEQGMILLDGRDINSIPLKELRRQIAYVPQDNFLFSDTLKANIAFGVEGQDMEQIIAATKAACIHDSIMEFPDQYDTMVGERGVTLSGGQKQRSSIARALMKDAPILILDDALSAVDTDTEEQLLRNLQENRRGKTTILIAHRISTIQHADVILVLEDGRAAEVGDHAQLMEQKGIYFEMFEKQQLEAAMGEQRAALHREYQDEPHPFADETAVDVQRLQEAAKTTGKEAM
ncbi:MAG: ABC transporter ATP-binding protein/permease [bacterium]|nr:ABC transporter ATP-binding protein/permease [bacterium]MCM1373561.1 ABC transporter ATP-binding protein/permease [Muribaculum sp.]